MSHFVYDLLYDLRSRPLVRDLTARVRGQIASDHCRSDLITGRTHWSRAGYPFPEVNLPETERRFSIRLTGSSTVVDYWTTKNGFLLMLCPDSPKAIVGVCDM